MPSLIPSWKVETALLPGSAAGTSHGGVRLGEDSFLVRGGEVIYPNYHGHPAQQPARMQEVGTVGSRYPVPAPVPAQRLHPSAVSHHMEW